MRGRTRSDAKGAGCLTSGPSHLRLRFLPRGSGPTPNWGPAGTTVPDWSRGALAGLVGHLLAAAVVEVPRAGRAVVQLTEPAVLSKAEGSARPGSQVWVDVVAADVATGRSVLRIAEDGDHDDRADRDDRQPS